MTTLEILFYIALFVVFYTYLGYGIVLYLLVKVKELFAKPKGKTLPADEQLPEVTLFITAYNEEAVVDEKMLNSLALDYPAVKKKIVWVTDGSADGTNTRLANRSQATAFFNPQGKTTVMDSNMALIIRGLGGIFTKKEKYEDQDDNLINKNT